MDPLVLLDQAEAQSKIPRTLARKVRLRMNLLAGAVNRAQSASGIKYPPYYVEPVLPVARSSAEYGEMGVLFARVIPTTATGSLAILVQFTAALVAYGSRATVDAVAAHELTHYVDFVRRFSTSDVAAEDRATTLFESTYADSERLVPPKLLFDDRALVALITRKFKNGFSDAALNKKVSEAWVGKGLPMRWVTPDENNIRLAMNVVTSTRFDPLVIAKVQEIKKKMKL